jgi:amino acid transporter
LTIREVVRGKRPGDRFIRVTRHPSFERLRPGVIEALPDERRPRSRANRLRRVVLGTPLRSEAETTERVNVPTGLAIFASDNISSSAYATEEIMRVLILAGLAALSLTLPITLAIIALLAVVVLSYRQVIAAYPNGGGSYVVAHQNLGTLPGLVAGAALLTDYILTVAVSVSAGVNALSSAFASLHDWRVPIALAVITLMTLVNLRGLRESGRAFTVPTSIYVFAILGLIGYGVVLAILGDLPEYSPPPEWLEEHVTQPLAVLLILRAFASGAVALTGTEAVSNGVPAFQPPEVRNAQRTLVIMGTLFGTIFLGLSFLSSQLDIVPDPHETETVLSILTRVLTGEGWYFYLMQFSTALLLFLAANTAFNGFPRLASILAEDHFVPRQFSFRGDRLAFTGGIVLLSVVAGLLIWIYEASVTSLIPLYTVGVFLAFTLSQSGLVLHWWRERGQLKNWHYRAFINGLGAAVTGLVTLVVGISKFTLGAWMVLVLIPVLVWIMWNIARHYRTMDQVERLDSGDALARAVLPLRVVIPVSHFGPPVRQALAYALTIAPANRVYAVHVTDSDAGAEAFSERWRALDSEAHLVIIEDPFRGLVGPLMSYVDALREAHPTDVLTVLLPEYMPRHWWEHLLHNQTALRIRSALRQRPGVIIASVPYRFEEE